MKLRIRGQSVRFRLSPDDVATLGRGEPLKESLVFGPSTAFVYGLVPSDVTAITVDAETNALLFLCPRRLIATLVETEEVGFESVVDGVEPGLTVLVEKDFQCLIPRGEDDGTTFPHPNART